VKPAGDRPPAWSPRRWRRRCCRCSHRRQPQAGRGSSRR
jgi:hypothetical protein